MPEFDTTRIRRYYDRNTADFVAHGQGGSEGAIHRAVWGPGADDRRAAFHFVEERIADVIRDRSSPHAPAHVVDLGCGIGASLCYLAQRLPVRGTGITLSPAQAEIGRQRIGGLGLDDRVTCLEGDYTHLPPASAPRMSHSPSNRSSMRPTRHASSRKRRGWCVQAVR